VTRETAGLECMRIQHILDHTPGIMSSLLLAVIEISPTQASSGHSSKP
jgi:uncharacterized membrane protein YgaE (UPF0421/DUF939 family)